MKYYIDEDLNLFLEDNVEAIIELVKKSYDETKKYFLGKKKEDFLYFNKYVTFKNGYCFYFARLLKSIYKNGKFVVVDKNYAKISHIYLMINNEIYDIGGKRSLNKLYILTNDDIKFINENHFQIDEEVYKKFKQFFKENVNKYIKLHEEIIKNNKL